MTTETASIHHARTFEPGERYTFDFDECHFKKGWAQIDTSQDAWYFGTWANPTELKITSYTEGDVCRTTCDTPEAFVAEIRRLAEWNTENGYGCAIDGMCRPEIIEAFERFGLGDLLH